MSSSPPDRKLPDHLRNADVSVDDIFAILAGDMVPQDIHDRRRKRQERRAAARLQHALEAKFAKLSTRELLKRWARIRFYGDWDSQARRFEYDTEWWALRKVLATREHVPSKREGERNRRRLAKRQHGNSKSKNR